MLCWVRPYEKKELKEDVKGRFPIEFAKTIDSFKQKIKENDYLVISSILANDKGSIEKLQQLVRSFPKNIFVLHDSYTTSKEGLYDLPSIATTLWDEPNVLSTWYQSVEIVNNFLGIIPDLEEYNQKTAVKKINSN
jgi:hypothetical protein